MRGGSIIYKSALITLTIMTIASNLGNHGCTVLPEDEDDDQSQTTVVGAGENFYVTLESNPTTGYKWEAEYDSVYLELLEEKFIKDNDDPELVGAPGHQRFKFKALNTGQTEIKMLYKRSWENEAIEEKIINVKIITR
ncbi:hypothetical protein GF312_22495 [Candidatus Poribacteria bacterium]|nr:hypothetical protein [Candidatus Poribacteria bacterium]